MLGMLLIAREPSSCGYFHLQDAMPQEPFKFIPSNHVRKTNHHGTELLGICKREGAISKAFHSNGRRETDG
ncbi:hypothetical protein GF325_01330 [Candidatus Bathyarchaeota archaeon]|nr:hypothetical protein [Candidatus Bathyarchaeota archaeon]